jgi:hypothetical protein
VKKLALLLGFAKNLSLQWFLKKTPNFPPKIGENWRKLAKIAEN